MSSAAPSAALLPAALILISAAAAHGQLTERPGGAGDDPIDLPRDLSGLSIKSPRVRCVHTTDPSLAGGSMYLQRVDPWLGYQLGRDLLQRELRDRDGVNGDAGKLDGPLLSDGASKMQTRSHVSSCAACHNTPYRDAGAGATIAKNGGEGRNTPHLFGAGLIEMLGQEIRRRALAAADLDRNGWISTDEMEGKRCVVATIPAGMPEACESRQVDYGSFGDEDGDGRPDLNSLFHPFYVDADGKRIASAASLSSPGVAGYSFEVQCFGFGHLYLPFRPPVSTTLRSFIAGAFDIHSGMQAYDPTTLDDPDGDGWARESNAGSLQCVTAAGKDRGPPPGSTSRISTADPDRDGYCEELSEGDLDLAEHYLLNHPAPARGRITASARRGEELFAALGCASCHVPDWGLPAAAPAAVGPAPQPAGDRRFFRIETRWNEAATRLEGQLVLLADRRGEQLIPRREAFVVRGLYSDLKYHDLGEAFVQVQFDGSLVRRWRTTPLWGVASTAPYGHDGASLSLDEVIRRHGGEALESRKAYAALPEADADAVLDFLGTLILFQTDRLACDIDGDGRIAERFEVADRDTGLERLNPEWLFRVPGRIEGPVTNLQGEPIVSFALVNVREAYGLDLELLRDRDRDGFPDAQDPASASTGYRDGER
jgi:hypothetical protein